MNWQKFYINTFAVVLLGHASCQAMSLPTPRTTEHSAYFNANPPLPQPDSINWQYIPTGYVPPAKPTFKLPNKISLQDAILLALRNNPNIIGDELQRVLDKFSVLLAFHAFQPQYTLTSSATYDARNRMTYEVKPAVSLKNTIGTQMSVDYTNDLNGTPGAATFSLTQPLLKGFGYVNRIPLDNAISQEKVNKLEFKNNVINVVVQVIQQYRQLMEDYMTIKIQQRTLQETIERAKQYALQVKLGRMAPSQLVQSQVTVSTTRSSLVSQEESAQQAYRALLSVLGLPPTSHLQIDDTVGAVTNKVPDKDRSINIALENNIPYQQALLNLDITKRALITAKDNRKWTLNLTANYSAGTTTTGGFGTPSTGPQVGVNLTVPIDDLQSKSDLVTAYINLENAKLQLEQQKRDLVNSVLSQLDTISNAIEQVKVSKETVVLQTQNLKASELKLKYGKSTAFEVSQIQDELLQNQTSLVSAEIALLNAITNFNQLLGVTLTKWHINLRY